MRPRSAIDVSEGRACDVCMEFLDHLVQLRDDAQMCIALPGEVDQWWRRGSQMKVAQVGNKWRVEGPGEDRARVSAALENGRVAYSID